jgi:hypothetical protein
MEQLNEVVEEIRKLMLGSREASFNKEKMDKRKPSRAMRMMQQQK